MKNSKLKKPVGKLKKKINTKQQFLNNVIVTILILTGIALIYSFFVANQEKPEEIPLSQLVLDVSTGLVAKITVAGEKLEIEYADGVIKNSKKEVGTALSQTLVNHGLTAENLAGVHIEIKRPSGIGFWLLNLAPFIFPLIIIILFFWLIFRQVKGSGGMQAFTFGQSKAKMIDPNDKKQRVAFKDVAGAKEAKQELLEVVEFLKNPKKFLQIGARIPKGVMLIGSPGTGKTLLARAVAGEAGVPFFIISGSEFVEMFVGVGASRVRSLFKTAKKIAPAIIFVDEIDAVGRVRGTGVGGGNDEREQTLNQILVEMDGFEPHEKVIVIAATNRPDVLDPALLRPGRFDRRVMIDLPDINDREEILKIHAGKKPLEDDVDLRVIAERTPGFSGADLSSLMNEGAILAAQENHKKVSQFDFLRSIEKVMLGPERKSHLFSAEEKEISAYHEAGHALVASLLDCSDPVHKISIIARGYTGGYTLTLPSKERRMQSKKHFIDDIAKAFGGFVAEKMQFNDITTGSSNDIQVASALARDMVTKYGMSKNLGPIAFESTKSIDITGKGLSKPEYSEEVAKKIDDEVSQIMKNALVRTEDILLRNKVVLDDIAKTLIKKETLERGEFEKILIAHNIKPKHKKDDAKDAKSDLVEPKT